MDVYRFLGNRVRFFSAGPEYQLGTLPRNYFFLKNVTNFSIVVKFAFVALHNYPGSSEWRYWIILQINSTHVLQSSVDLGCFVFCQSNLPGCRLWFNKNSSPISFGIRSETYRTRLEIGPDLLSCSIKWKDVYRFLDNRVRFFSVGPEY